MLPKSLSIPRTLNLIRLGIDYWVALVTRRPILHAKPIAASIEPANFCNLACRQCPTGLGLIQKKPVRLDVADFKRFVQALLPELCYLNLYFQGEPFLHPQLPDMLAFARENHLYTCVSTNGHFLNQAMVEKLRTAPPDRLIICLDGADEASYTAYRRGGNFHRVIDGIRNAVQAGLPVEIQCLLLSSTERQKPAVEALARKLGVSKVHFKKAQFYNEELMPEQAENLRYQREADGGFRMKKPLRNRCWRLWSSVVIAATGDVVPCCFDKDLQHAFGNLRTQDFRQLWFGEKAISFRRQVLHARKDIPMCCNCVS